MLPHRFFHPDYAPVYVPIALSLAGTIFFMHADRLHLIALLSERWSLHYLLATPFIHSGVAHFLFNALALHYIGGDMLLRITGKRHFILLLIAGALVGGVANNLLSQSPAIGMSSAIMATLGTTLYPYARAPMRLLFIHDILRLPPFQFRHIVGFVIVLDLLGILFGWHFFAHWAHLGGMATGLAYGYWRFRRLPF